MRRQIVCHTAHEGDVVLVEEDDERWLEISDGDGSHVTSIRHSEFVALCMGLRFDPPGPALSYTTTDRPPVSWYIDRGEPFENMEPRERALCAALLKFAMGKLDPGGEG